ncbi:MAG: YtcA family lipoprotein [Burkholderiales bacterium]
MRTLNGRLSATLSISALLSGCASAPSISVLGAFFPDWMFCIAAAIILTNIVHFSLAAAGWIKWIRGGSLPVVYSALTALFAFACWLLFFKN